MRVSGEAHTLACEPALVATPCEGERPDSRKPRGRAIPAVSQERRRAEEFWMSIRQRASFVSG